jgi:glucosyl-3-phosphoglycerate phosphatase
MGMARLLGIPDEVRILGLLGNCRWSVIGRRRGQWRLLEHNVGKLPEPVPDPDAEPGPDAERED